MKLILTRHGETEANTQRVIQGHIPGKLTKKGEEQAEKLAIKLKETKIDIIYSSDLKRAADTAKIIAQYHKNTPINFVKELRERDYGAFSGKFGYEVDWDNFPKDAETIDDMHKRMKKYLDKIYMKHTGKTVLFVSHGAIGRVVVNILMNNKQDKYFEIEKLQNTSLSLFEFFEDKSHKIHLLNNTEHLE